MPHCFGFARLEWKSLVCHNRRSGWYLTGLNMNTGQKFCGLAESAAPPRTGHHSPWLTVSLSYVIKAG